MKLYTLEQLELGASWSYSQRTPSGNLLTFSYTVVKVVHRHHPDDRQTNVYILEPESITEG